MTDCDTTELPSGRDFSNPYLREFRSPSTQDTPSRPRQLNAKGRPVRQTNMVIYPRTARTT
jgi:hypothetical protein